MNGNYSKVNYYTTLGISQCASKEEIRKAYLALSLCYHPDKNKTEEAKVLLQSVQEAYAVLTDPIEKEKHDQSFNSEDFFTDDKKLEMEALFRKYKSDIEKRLQEQKRKTEEEFVAAENKLRENQRLAKQKLEDAKNKHAREIFEMKNANEAKKEAWELEEERKDRERAAQLEELRRQNAQKEEDMRRKQSSGYSKNNFSDQQYSDPYHTGYAQQNSRSTPYSMNNNQQYHHTDPYYPNVGTSSFDRPDPPSYQNHNPTNQDIFLLLENILRELRIVSSRLDAMENRMNQNAQPEHAKTRRWF